MCSDFNELIGFLNLFNLSSHIMARGSIQPITEVSSRNLPGLEGQLVHKVFKLTAICDVNVYKCGSFNIS
jgi:hypothetical protein